MANGTRRCVDHIPDLIMCRDASLVIEQERIRPTRKDRLCGGPSQHCAYAIYERRGDSIYSASGASPSDANPSLRAYRAACVRLARCSLLMMLLT